ncbi:polyketide synthase docking domain-containing protein [Micromonospora schwarzwaldensis]
MSNDEKLRTYLRQATDNLLETRRRLQEIQDRATEPIAVVSMACRFSAGIETRYSSGILLPRARPIRRFRTGH